MFSKQSFEELPDQELLNQRKEAYEQSPDFSRRASLELYEAVLGFNRNDLVGKTILDLGSGRKTQLAQDLKAHQIKARVISFDSKLKLEKTKIKN